MRAVRIRIPRLKAWQWALLATAGLAVVGALGWASRHVAVGEVVARVRTWDPVPFFAAVAVLPSLGVPIAPFYLAAGAAFPFPVAVTGTLIAMAANIAISYALARWVLRPLIERLARRMGYSIPVVRAEDRWVITLLLRITPGPPFFMQHYLLALGGVPFGIYMIVSVAVSGLLAVGFVGVGAGLTSGRTINIIVGVFVLVAVLVGIRFLRRVLQRRAQVRVGGHREVEPDLAPGRTPGL